LLEQKKNNQVKGVSCFSQGCPCHRIGAWETLASAGKVGMWRPSFQVTTVTQAEEALSSASDLLSERLPALALLLITGHKVLSDMEKYL